MNLAIELEKETDGRWIAEIDALNAGFWFMEKHARKRLRKSKFWL